MLFIHDNVKHKQLSKLPNYIGTKFSPQFYAINFFKLLIILL